MELDRRRELKDWQRELMTGLVIFGLVFIRYCYYGFEYYFQMDDFIPYHNYVSYNDDLWDVVMDLGLLASRPLAGLLDLYFWAKFFNCMIWAVAIISAMYAASAVILQKIFSRRFGTGMLFYVIFALAPFGFEGAYWVNASTRVIVGIFFASLSLLYFDRWCREGGTRRLIAFAAFQLTSFMFYEQVLLLSCALTFVIMLLCLEEKQKRGLWGFLMFAGAGIYFLIISLVPSVFYDDRKAIVLPWQDYWPKAIVSAAGQIAESFWGCLCICGKGLVRGFRLLFTEPNVLWVLAVLLLCAALFLLAKSFRGKGKFSPAWELLCGLFLTLAPMAVFFILEAPSFGLRNVLPCLCGISLIADALFELLFRRIKGGETAKAAAAAVLALMFSIASVSEIHDYRESYRADAAIASSTAAVMRPFANEPATYILNVEPSYVTDGNFYYHEHNYGMSSTDWSFTGAVQYYMGYFDWRIMTPVPARQALSVDQHTAHTAALYFYEDGNCFRAWREGIPGKENNWRIVTSAGEKGLLRWQDGYMSFELCE